MNCMASGQPGLRGRQEYRQLAFRRVRARSEVGSHLAGVTVMGLHLRLFTCCTLLLLMSAPAYAARRTPAKKSATLNAAAVNGAAGYPTLNSSAQHGAAVLRAQILLDRKSVV